MKIHQQIIDSTPKYKFANKIQIQHEIQTQRQITDSTTKCKFIKEIQIHQRKCKIFPNKKLIRKIIPIFAPSLT